MSGSDITIKDIARFCGVSITTVSKVINGKCGGIGANTIEKIQAAVREHNYSPNAVARSMITRKSHTIGLVVPDVRNPFFSDLARGVEDVCNERSYGCFLCNTDGSLEKEDNYVRLLRGRVADGMLFTTQNRIEYNPVFAKLREKNYPFCVIERYLAELPDVPGVYFDNVGGARMATEYLIAHGHRRIAFISGPATTTNAQLRIRGYLDALAAGGIEADAALRVEGDYRYSGGYRAIDRLLAAGGDFTALFASNDLMALGAYQRLGELRLKVPERVSLIGFDNAPFPEVFRPAVTTIEIPAYPMGRRSAEMLFDRIAGKPDAEARFVFQPKLVEKESVRRI